MTVYLSASSIKDFIVCPQRVLYRITKPFQAVQSREMVLGEIAHKALELGWKDKKTAYSILSQELEKRRLSASDVASLEFFIDVFFLNFRGLLQDDDTIEYSFKVQLYEDVVIVGKVDRISNGNIFDWKTGKVPKSLSNDVQCIIYDYAYNTIFGKAPSSICMASVSDGTITPYRRNESHVNEVFTKVIPSMIKSIRDSSYEKYGLFNHGCFKCQFRYGCLGGNSELDSSKFTE